MLEYWLERRLLTPEINSNLILQNVFAWNSPSFSILQSLEKQRVIIPDILSYISCNRERESKPSSDKQILVKNIKQSVETWKDGDCVPETPTTTKGTNVTPPIRFPFKRQSGIRWSKCSICRIGIYVCQRCEK